LPEIWAITALNKQIYIIINYKILNRNCKMDIKKPLKTEMPDARERENRLKVGKDSM
jgi:hypothetical protein